MAIRPIHAFPTASRLSGPKGRVLTAQAPLSAVVVQGSFAKLSRGAGHHNNADIQLENTSNLNQLHGTATPLPKRIVQRTPNNEDHWHNLTALLHL